MKKIILILILILIILGGYFWYTKYYIKYEGARSFQREMKLDTKIAKENVLDNIKFLRESIDTKELGTGEDLSIGELGMAKDKRAVPILCEILTQYTEPVQKPEDRGADGTMDGADYMRMDAAQALGDIGDKSAIPALIKASIEDKNKEVRESALGSYASLKGVSRQDVLNVLNEASKSLNEEIKQWAEKSIDEMNKSKKEKI
jgi:HEAT repeat protein